MNPEVAALTTEQQAVLQAVYDHFREHAAWPTFITIDRRIRRQHGWNTGTIVMSLPESMIVLPRQSLRPIATDELHLRLLGIHACQGGSEDTDRFIRLLRWLAEQEMAYEPQPGGDTMPRITSAEVGQYLGLGDEGDQLALNRLYAMLHLDNWGLSGGSSINADGWHATIGQDIWRFRDVQTVEDCIKVQEEWAAETRPPSARELLENIDWANWGFTSSNDTGADDEAVTGPSDGSSSSEDPPISEPSSWPVSSPYVDQRIIDAIQAKNEQSTFDITKLLGLIAELNQNYAHRHTYASHALLRAILDHVPPILGCVDFKAVANNYSWGRTDRNYIKRLLAFRDQADDALHRQISAKVDVLDFDDMPAGVCVDRLLQECAERL